MLYTVAYDIVSDKWRNKVAHLLDGYGDRVQKSVFEVRLAPEELEGLCRKLTALLDADEDSVRIYPILPRAEAELKLLGNAVPWADPEVLVI